MKPAVLSLILIFALYAQPSFTIQIDKINPQDTTFPGGRGANQLVIYTPEYGDSTGTNQYGLEAVVQNHVVQKVGGNNSAIPANGFVISGHGSKSSWIAQHLFPGVEVHLVQNRLQCSVQARSYVFLANYYLKRAVENVKRYKQETAQQAYYQNLERQLEALEQQLSKIKKPASLSAQRLDSLVVQSKRLFYQTFPVRQNEKRAVWYHIRESNARQLEEAVRQMKELGFNVICPETIYQGYAIYPHAHPDLPQHPQFVGWDPLAELVRLCKKYDMRLVPWVWVFFVGREQSPLVKNKEPWLAVSFNGQHASEVEKGYYFFCPAREEVQRFWLEVYENLLSRYAIDGLQLDYIRYPGSYSYQDGFCYCTHCRKKFTLDYLLDPKSIDPQSDPEAWKDWQLFREKQVNRFVGRVHRLIQQKFPQVKLSADVFPVLKESRSIKMQNWGAWLKNDYLQEIFTMSYTPDVRTVEQEARYLKRIAPPEVFPYVGLGPYQKFSAEILLDEIQKVREAGIGGICLFEFGNLTPEQREALRLGPFRK